MTQAGEAIGLILGQPAVDGVGLTGFEQAVAGDPVRRVTLSDLE
jgi:hypothetical protein